MNRLNTEWCLILDNCYLYIDALFIRWTKHAHAHSDECGLWRGLFFTSLASCVIHSSVSLFVKGHNYNIYT